MPAETNDVAHALARAIFAIRDLNSDQLADVCNHAADILSGFDGHAARGDQLLDGLRWGHEAAQHVSARGRCLVRILIPDGHLTFHLPDHACEDTASRIERVTQILLESPAAARPLPSSKVPA